MSEKKFQVGAKALIVEDGAVLLLRSRYSSGAPYWDLPGGRYQEGDKNIVSCLVREVTEELPGIADITVKTLVSCGRMPRDFSDGTGLFGVFYKVTATLPRPLQLTDEHHGHEWMTIDEVKRLYDDPSRTMPFDEVFYNACIEALKK